MEENKSIDKKSFKSLRGKQTNWDELGKDCVCFANAQGGFKYIGIDDSASLPPENRKVEEINKSILQKALEINLLVEKEVIL